jgi:hypothetical protein
MADVGEDDRAAATAEYIRGMARELQAMAARADLGFLAYLLSMVEQEAGRASSSGGAHASGPEA